MSGYHPAMASEPFVSGVLLAAGRGRRLRGHGPKPLVEVGGVALVRRAALAMLESRLAQTVAVLGHAERRVREALAGLAVEPVRADGWRSGQSASVRAGLAARDPRATAALFVPCDQPFLDAALIDRLLAAFGRGGSTIVAPRWRDRPGAPVLFGRRHFAAIEALRGDAGARPLLDRHRDEVAWVELADELPLLDVDTAADLARLERAAQSSSS